MSTTLEKAAAYTPAELLLMSILAGGSAFGGMRLINDMHNEVSPLTIPDNNIKLELPDPRRKHMQEHTEDIDSASASPAAGSQIPGINKSADDGQSPGPPWLQNIGAVGLGLPAGFLGVKALYDKYQNAEYNRKVEEAKKQYINQLNMASSMDKLSEETPGVDNLCEAMALELEKNAGLMTMLSNLGKKAPEATQAAEKLKSTPWSMLRKGAIGAGALATGLGLAQYHINGIGQVPKYAPSTGTLAGKPLVYPTDINSVTDANDTIKNNALVSFKNIINKLSGKSLSAAGTIGEGLVSAGTIGTLGLLLHNHEKRLEREQKADYPTTIEYAE